MNSAAPHASQALPLDPQGSCHDSEQDCVDTYFECITSCSLDDGECISVCTTQLRDAG